MVRYHHWLSGHESEQTPGDSKGQRNVTYCSGQGRRVGRDWVSTTKTTANGIVVFAFPGIVAPYTIPTFLYVSFVTWSRKKRTDDQLSFFTWICQLTFIWKVCTWDGASCHSPPPPPNPSPSARRTQYRAHQPEMIKTGHAFLKGDFREAKCNI